MYHFMFIKLSKSKTSNDTRKDKDWGEMQTLKWMTGVYIV